MCPKFNASCKTTDLILGVIISLCFSARYPWKLRGQVFHDAFDLPARSRESKSCTTPMVLCQALSNHDSPISQTTPTSKSFRCFYFSTLFWNKPATISSNPLRFTEDGWSSLTSTTPHDLACQKHNKKAATGPCNKPRHELLLKSFAFICDHRVVFRLFLTVLSCVLNLSRVSLWRAWSGSVYLVSGAFFPRAHWFPSDLFSSFCDSVLLYLPIQWVLVEKSLLFYVATVRQVFGNDRIT